MAEHYPAGTIFLSTLNGEKVRASSIIGRTEKEDFAFAPDGIDAISEFGPAKFNPWTCIRLAPQPMIRRIANRHDRVPVPGHQTELAKDLQLLTLDVGALVRFRSDVFLSTIDYLFCANLAIADPDCSNSEERAE